MLGQFWGFWGIVWVQYSRCYTQVPLALVAYSKHVSYFGIYYRANKLLVGGMGPFGDRIT